MKIDNLETILQKQKSTSFEKIILVLHMSLPAILAQLTSIAMQYIDAGMVGSLGANATASIGLVASSTWLIGGVCIGMSSGFSVQVAHLVGAGKLKNASSILRQSLIVLLGLSLVISLFGICISHELPVWLGGEPQILADSAKYFLIYSAAIPFRMLRMLCGNMMQCSGDMKTPSILSGCICFLDVVFNSFLIFSARTVRLLGFSFLVPGAGLGVTGAALGTALAEVIISLIMLYAVCFRNRKLSLKLHKGSWRLRKDVILRAVQIAVPLSLDQIFMCAAYIAGTRIVSPLGTEALAANSLAVTAESLCYMPGFGIGAAATAIIGQTIGAGRRDLTKSFSRISVVTGIVLMGMTGILMYALAPLVFSLLTSDPQVAKLGVKVLRIELIAEPLYGASICCAGVFRGAGDTLIPSFLNLVSMWFVRIVLAFFLVPVMGLAGYWTAMAVELCFRGVIFLLRMRSGRWVPINRIHTFL